jgi:hypothetical protein
MHRASCDHAATNRNATAWDQLSLRMAAMGPVLRRTLPLGLFLVLCLRHAVAGSVC